MSSRFCSFAASAVAVTLLSASALTAQVFNGTTLGGPTWNRPVEGNPPVPPLSGVGTAVSYDVVQFRVTLASTYDILSEALLPLSWDNYLFLYAGSFSAAAPFDNLIIGNDDRLFTIGRSGFDNVALSTGIDYYAVTTGFANSDAGTYAMTISGQGQAFVPQQPMIVPEPTAIALVCLGLGGLGIVAHRRRVS